MQALTKPLVFDDVPARQMVQPSRTLAAATHDLRRPFTVHAVQFRILEGRDGKRANCAAYLDAATVVDRLNLVVPGLWSDQYVPEQGGLGCGITIDGQTRWDVGTSLQPTTPMGFKGLRSDAFKRAAVKFGVGISLRALPGMVLYVEPGHVKVYGTGNGRDGQAKPKYFMTTAGEAELRKRYQAWLEGPGQHFGEPLDHGHVAGSKDAEDPAPQADAQVPSVDAAVVLPPEAQLVIEHASTVGHAQLSDPATVSMMVTGLSQVALDEWARLAHVELSGLGKESDAHS